MAPTMKAILAAKHGLEGKYVPDFGDLGKQVKLLKEAGYTIVLTQGVYDMFHPGHGRYLVKAAALGDVLIVGVDSDELTRSMKGEDRPFDPFEERVELLAMFSFVHIITRKHIDQHYNDLIKLVCPDVLVMSQTTSTFTEERKKEIEAYCGRIEHLEAQASNSTTAKLRKFRISGMKELAARIMKVIEDFLKEMES